MKVSGFSFIKNAIKYDYPIEEAIRSILPICDDFYIAVGKSDDDTLGLIKNIDPKIIIIETEWDDTLNQGGKVLAVETDKAFKAIPDDSDWCFYIQGDEIVHEKYLDTIREAMILWKEAEYVDGLLFNYLHFFGSYDYIATAPNWYRKEIRIVRNNKSFYSYKDAQGFRKDNNKKLLVKSIDAWIYHYGWVKHPKTQITKHKNFSKLFSDKESYNQDRYHADEFDYSFIDSLEKFTETHPKLIQKRIKQINWKFDYDMSYNKMSFKNRFKSWFEKHLGFIPGEYKNYRII